PSPFNPHPAAAKSPVRPRANPNPSTLTPQPQNLPHVPERSGATSIPAPLILQPSPLNPPPAVGKSPPNPCRSTSARPPRTPPQPHKQSTPKPKPINRKPESSCLRRSCRRQSSGARLHTPHPTPHSLSTTTPECSYY
ncbi:hypothetical protein T484DRAFT_1648485, partial [Baffinella frigidus]